MSRVPKSYIYQGRDEKWYFHVRDTNGEIVLQGQGYHDEDAAIEGYTNAREAVYQAVLLAGTQLEDGRVEGNHDQPEKYRTVNLTRE